MNDNFATSWKRFEELISWMGPEPVDLPPPNSRLYSRPGDVMSNFEIITITLSFIVGIGVA
jgi:hypothetical protein